MDSRELGSSPPMMPISCVALTGYLSACSFAHLKSGNNHTHLIVALLVDTHVTTWKVLRTALAGDKCRALSTEH